MSTSWSRLASSPSPPKVAAKPLSGGYQASFSILARIFAARRRQILARASEAEGDGDVGEPVAGGPAHHRAVGVDAGAGAELPQARVGLVIFLPGPLADLFQRREILGRRLAEQPFVEEGVGVGKDDLPVGVVLDLGVGGVADPHRPHAPIAGEALGDPLFQLGLARDRVERLDMPAARIVDDVAQIAEIAFEHVERAEPVERLQRATSSVL